MANSTYSLTASDGQELFAQKWQPDNDPHGLVCLVHGLGEHSSRYHHMADYFNAAGFAMAGFDLRGHGKSGGRRGHTPSYDMLMEDISIFLESAQADFGDLPMFIYGHSLGGNLTLNYLLRKKPDVAGSVVTGPWLRLAVEPPAILIFLLKLMVKIWPTFTQSNKLDADGLSHDEAVNQAYQDDELVHDRITASLFNGAHQAAEWAMENANELKLPLLLMHGAEDPLTSAEATEEFGRKNPELITLKIWDALYHEIHNEPQQKEIFELTVNWMNSVLGK